MQDERDPVQEELLSSARQRFLLVGDVIIKPAEMLNQQVIRKPSQAQHQRRYYLELAAIPFARRGRQGGGDGFPEVRVIAD